MKLLVTIYKSIVHIGAAAGAEACGAAGAASTKLAMAFLADEIGTPKPN